MILDIIIIGIVVLFVVIGVVRGIGRTLMNLLSMIGSAVFAYLGAGLLSNLIYTSIISPAITNKITDSMADSTTSAITIIHEAMDSLPEFVVNFLGMLGINIEALSKLAVSAITGSHPDIAGAVDMALKPVITSVMSAVFILILFILFFFIFRYIAKKAEHFFDFPIIGAINRILGGVLGFCEAAIICFLGIVVCRVIFVFSQDPFITMETINQSVIFAAVYHSDILNNIAGFLGAGNDLVQSAGNAASTEAS